MTETVTLVGNPRYDTPFQVLLNDTNRLKSFVNEVLALKDDDEIEEFQLITQFLPTGKKVKFDIFAAWICQRKNQTRFVLEIQKSMYRWMYKGARGLNNPVTQEFLQPHQPKSSMLPVKVLVVMDFDPGFTPSSKHVIEWKRKEDSSNEIPSHLLSCTFVILPRFQMQSQLLSTSHEAWLYLLTRNSRETVALTPEITQSNQWIIDSYRRLGSLSIEERWGVARDEEFEWTVGAEMEERENIRRRQKEEIQRQIDLTVNKQTAMRWKRKKLSSPSESCLSEEEMADVLEVPLDTFREWVKDEDDSEDGEKKIDSSDSKEEEGAK